MTTPTLPFGNGWYRVATADEIAPGAVKPVRFFGRELVLLRTEANQPRLLDAFCPHLGAHLGYGGVVEGDTIVCPFHAWRFSADGVCVSVPNARTPPPLVGKQCIRSWPITERNHCIYAWYHARGQSPAYEVEEISELAASDQWADIVWKQWSVRCQAPDIIENLYDVAHFASVHKVDVELHCQFDGHRGEITTRPADGGRHGNVTSHGLVRTYLNGPGQGWSLHEQLLPFVVLTHVTPVDHEQVIWHMGIAISRAMDSAIVRKWLVKRIHSLAEEDIPIFEHKVYRASPQLCAEDAPIAEFREWYRQFWGEPARGVAV